MSDIQERLNELDRALEQLRMPLDVMQRLHNAEQAINRTQARQDHADADTIARFKGIAITLSRGDDSVCDLVTRTANAIYKELKSLEGQYASTSRVERISEELGELRRELNIALANGHEESKQVNDRLDRHESLIADLIERGDRLTDGVNGKTAHTPEWPNVMPEPPIDTSWHPFNFSTDLRPDDDKHIMTLVRGGNNITGPWRAGSLNWEECDDATIIAWRYAKEGE